MGNRPEALPRAQAPTNLSTLVLVSPTFLLTEINRRSSSLVKDSEPPISLMMKVAPPR